MVVEGILTIIISVIVYVAIPGQIKVIETRDGGDVFYVLVACIYQV